MKKIYLIDWNAFIYRMFYGLPEFTTSDGEVVNAIFGMAKFFLHQLSSENPDYLVFIKDHKWKNFRHEIYSDYKATRDKMPDALLSQIWKIEEMIEDMGVDIVEIEWYEADDVIWTLSTKLWVDLNYQIYILSWDKDLYSLTTKNVLIYDSNKNKIYDESGTRDKFWVDARYLIDYLAIVWDTRDNIPWIAGFGPKKAIDLINTYGSVEDIYDHVDDPDFILTKKTYEKFVEWRDLAFLSKKLATISKDVDMGNFDIWDFRFDRDKLYNPQIEKLFEKYEFNSLVRKEIVLQRWDDLWLEIETITKDRDFGKLKRDISRYDEIVIDTETTSLDTMEADIVGISIYLDDEHIYYINYGHKWDKVSYEYLEDFINWLFKQDKTIIWHNLKYDLKVIDRFLENHIEKTKISKNDNIQLSLI